MQVAVKSVLISQVWWAQISSAAGRPAARLAAGCRRRRSPGLLAAVFLRACRPGAARGLLGCYLACVTNPR
jgi:hypothetical protein